MQLIDFSRLTPLERLTALLRAGRDALAAGDADTVDGIASLFDREFALFAEGTEAIDRQFKAALLRATQGEEP